MAERPRSDSGILVGIYLAGVAWHCLCAFAGLGSPTGWRTAPWRCPNWRRPSERGRNRSRRCHAAQLRVHHP